MLNVIPGMYWATNCHKQTGDKMYRHTLLKTTLVSIITLTTMLSTLTVFAAELNNEFFVFDNGAGRGQWAPEQQAKTLANLGYAGIGYSGTEDLETRMTAFKKHGLNIYNLYVPCYVDKNVAYGDDLKEAIKLLKGTDVALWLTVQGQAKDDAKAVEVVSEIADLAAASGIKVALYPHHGFYVDEIGDALRVVKKANRENLGVTFNLCHELKAGNEAQFATLLKEAAPHLFFVSINGADHEGNWDTLIQPLGEGVFDLKGLLAMILDLGYIGPIGLQCYAVPGDTLENLTHNIAEWKKLVKDFATN